MFLGNFLILGTFCLGPYKISTFLETKCIFVSKQHSGEEFILSPIAGKAFSLDLPRTQEKN